MRLENRVALVTGGSSGIGRGIALELARQGARIVVSDVQEAPKRGRYHETDTATTTAAEIIAAGGQAVFVAADVSQEADVERMIAAAAAAYGGLDILVNNAGVYVHSPDHSQSLAVADWDRMIAVNLRGPFLTTRAAMPHLKRSAHGRIIHIASVHAYGGGAGPAYAPAKAALVNLTRDTALEAGPFGITVNVICPGYIETAIQDYLTQEQIDACLARTPLGRHGRPGDIAHAVAFFASEEAAWITGASLVVDGGLIAAV